MRRPALALLLTSVAACSGPQEVAAPVVPAPVAAKPRLAYPPTKKVQQVDDYHGTKVADPFRWLEGDGPDTLAWIEAQNALTFGILGKIPAREAIRKQLAGAWDYPRWTPPVREGGRLFFRHNTGLQNQAVLNVVDAAGKEPRLLLDPNTLAKDGTVALSVWAPSRDGKLLGYGLSTAGSDWVEIKVRDVTTGQDLPDHLKWVKFSGIAWTPDHKGFFYSRYEAPADGKALSGVNKFQKVYYHRLGEPQDKDALVYERKDQPDWGFGAEVSRDGKYLILSVWKGADNKNLVFYQELGGKNAKVVELTRDFDSELVFLDNDGPVMTFRTDKGAPRGRIVAVDVGKPAEWKELVAQTDDTLESATVVGGRFLLHYLRNATSVVKLHHLDGKPAEAFPLPPLGTASGFTGQRGDGETYFSSVDFLSPGRVLRYDFKTGKTDVFAEPKTGLDRDQFVAKQVWFQSKDGTKVPMFVVHRKDLKLDGSAPAYLFGYGGFNITMTPFFSPPVATWLKMGGVFAMPNLRGGGEFGQAWHEAGMKGNKQAVFDDFIGAAETLIKDGYTRPQRLAIAGGSNGGLLVGACITQRPDLFGAALPAVGVMDMLRFHKFTIGWAWVPEYGSADNPEDFANLLKYSPLHAIKPGTRYPATLVTTADHDDRVVPYHSFKFAAALQEAQAGDAPVLIRIETKAGHGAGKPTAKLIDEAADRLAFLVHALGIQVPQSFGASQQAAQ